MEFWPAADPGLPGGGGTPTSDAGTYVENGNEITGCSGGGVTGGYLTITGQNDKIFNVYIEGKKVHICTKFEVSMFNPVAKRGVHSCQQHQ